MKFSESLKSNSDFRRVYRGGKSYANKYLVMYVLENGTDKNRLGISVSKKVGNSVVRHRITRLVRESYRLHENIFNSGLDIVVVARVGAKEVGYAEIESALLHVSKLHRILIIHGLFQLPALPHTAARVVGVAHDGSMDLPPPRSTDGARR